MKIDSTEFGQTKDGKPVTEYKITNSSGSYISVLNFGAILKNIAVPDKNGKLTDVVLGYDNLADYESNPNYFGATIGRNANRIENGRFSLDGLDYQLALNDGHNNNHSGPDGYERRMWEASADEKSGSVTMRLISPDGDQGFPGELHVSVTYTLTEDNTVRIHFEGKALDDTIVNMTNHSYFNLNGEGTGSILMHSLEIAAEGYVPADEYSIPYGYVEPVEGTPFDFRKGKTIARDMDISADEQLGYANGYDHTFAIDGTGFRKAAWAAGELSGITLTVSTDQPGVQLYTGNYISGPKGKGGHEYHVRDGFALEAQHFPNSVNVLAFESPRVGAGERYSTTTCYTFGVI